MKPDFFIKIAVLLISIAIHEFAHCWTTDRLGDDTPRRAGRLTLNPLAHLDPIGTLMMVVSTLSGFGIGWGKASPFNPNNFAHPARDRMLTAIAGPLSNLLQMFGWASLAALTMPFLRYSPHAPLVEQLFRYGVVINAALACFNLLPIAPLDGHHILSYIAPPSLRPVIDNPIWGVALLVLVLGFRGVLSSIIDPFIGMAIHATHYLAGWPPIS